MTGAAPEAARLPSETPLLAIEGVSVTLPTPRGVLTAVDDVSLELAAGRKIGRAHV